MKKSEVNEKFSRLAELLISQKQIEAQVADLKDTIKEYMEKNKLSELVGTEHKATYKEISQMRLDRKALEAEHPRIAKKYLVDASYMRLNFS